MSAAKALPGRSFHSLQLFLSHGELLRSNKIPAMLAGMTGVGTTIEQVGIEL
jgi:hypothetical protein